MADFLIIAAETMKEKADKEASAGLKSAAQSYKAAAHKYRQAAERYPDKREVYLTFAQDCEDKAVAVSNGSFASNASGNSSNKPNAFGNQRGSNGGNGGGTPPQRNNNQPNANVNANFQRRAETSAQTKPQTQPMTVEEAMSELDKLIGLGSVKEKIKTWVGVVKANERRKQAGLATAEGFSYHLVFAGNPGTGKTTVARLMGQIYRALGVLSGGEVIEVQRVDLVAGYVGQTAVKTQEVIDKSMGNVLFIDEVYTLSRGGENDFGKEAIDTLLTAMENHRDNLVVIVAGYTNLMAEFLKTNPGLCSRFNINVDENETQAKKDQALSNLIEFEDYTPDEMYRIYLSNCKKSDYVLDDEADRALRRHLEYVYANRGKNFGNARDVRNLFQATVSRQAQRMNKIDNPTIEEMKTLIRRDLPFLVE